jgi:hypothetical protein
MWARAICFAKPLVGIDSHHVQPNFFPSHFTIYSSFLFFLNISKWLKVITYFRKLKKHELLPRTNILNVIGGSTWCGGRFVLKSRNLSFSETIYLKSVLYDIVRNWSIALHYTRTECRSLSFLEADVLSLITYASWGIDPMHCTSRSALSGQH